MDNAKNGAQDPRRLKNRLGGLLVLLCSLGVAFACFWAASDGSYALTILKIEIPYGFQILGVLCLLAAFGGLVGLMGKSDLSEN